MSAPTLGGTQGVEVRFGRMSRELDEQPSPRRVIMAWSVHLLTASGALWALLALDALWRDDWRSALFWLFVALVIDGVDGTLARALRVNDYVPRIDGASLDLIVDYLNYVLLPTLLIWRFELLPESLTLPLAALILISSLYVFVRRDMKTADGYFRGFPALWNVVAVYLLLIDPGEWICAAIVTTLALASFAPVFVIHPFRAADFPRSAPLLASGWILSTSALLLPNLAGSVSQAILSVSTACLLGLMLMGIRRSFCRPVT